MEENNEERESQNQNPLSEVDKIKNYLQEENNKTNLVEYICKQSNSELQKLKDLYLSSYGTELTKEIENFLSGDIKSLILGLMQTPVEFDAEKIYSSMKGLGTDEETLSEMIATRTSRQLLKIKEKYPELYNETLEEAIKGDTSKSYQKILIAMIQGQRSDNPYPDKEKMNEIIEKLKDNDENNLLEDNFISTLVNCSYSEICTLCRLYEKKYEKNILETIKKVFNEDAYNFTKILLEYITDTGKYYAEKIHGFKSKDLIRIFVGQSEENMEDIRIRYKELYNIDLIDDIKNNTKDEFQTALCILAQK